MVCDIASCSFSEFTADRLFYIGPLISGIWDAHPVSPGHALLLPHRHVESWFDATPQEQSELTAAIVIACAAIRQRHAADGFNIGINMGVAAGQTVPHLHMHVIPRYRGDVSDPRGGIRYIISGKRRRHDDDHGTDQQLIVS